MSEILYEKIDDHRSSIDENSPESPLIKPRRRNPCSVSYLSWINGGLLILNLTAAFLLLKTNSVTFGALDYWEYGIIIGMTRFSIQSYADRKPKRLCEIPSAMIGSTSTWNLVNRAPILGLQVPRLTKNGMKSQLCPGEVGCRLSAVPMGRDTDVPSGNDKGAKVRARQNESVHHPTRR